jgi:hypothetical protein
MSRGAGRIEAAIQKLFAEHPDVGFTTDDLVQHCFPDIRAIEKKHRVSILRATSDAKLPAGWRGYRERYTPTHTIGEHPHYVHQNVALTGIYCWGYRGPKVCARSPEIAWYRLSGLSETLAYRRPMDRDRDARSLDRQHVSVSPSDAWTRKHLLKKQAYYVVIDGECAP